MADDQRPAKIFKLFYHPDVKANISIFQDEIRIGGSDKTFVAVSEAGITLQGGLPSKVSLGSMSPIYGGMVQNTIFPLSLIGGPTGPPSQLPKIPLEPILGLLEMIGTLVKGMVA
jgi:hypothetical protein